MLRSFKRFFYFPVAAYFRFFAQIQLALWHPRIVVVTGSSGKTTLLHLIESQLQQQARYSHHANSTFGIPFDILDLRREDLVLVEWVYLFILTPFKAFRKPYSENIYIVEADCDRPGEGKFLASLLKPEVTLWISTSRTHSMNFDQLVKNRKFTDVDQAIAYEFGYFLEYTTRLVIVEGDSKLISKQLIRTKAEVKSIKRKQLTNYKVRANETEFKIDGKRYLIQALLPEESFYSIAMANQLTQYLDLTSDSTFSSFQLPPGRSSVFKGLKNTTLIDSSYNATLDGMTAILKMFDLYPGKNKWLVLGDILEQGNQEQEEHEKLAELISRLKVSKIILIGPRVSKYTYPKLKSLVNNSVEIQKFILPKEALDFLTANIKDGEIILFKGARFLEGVIEYLLQNKSDIKKLCRREKIWQLRRKQWDL